MSANSPQDLGLPEGIRALLFDLDGVLTKTAVVHAAAWKQMFDDFLKARAEKSGDEFVPFDSDKDYGPYVDGKPRYDGVQSFLESRGIELPQGTPDDDPDEETIDGLGNRKNELVLALIKKDGVEAYEGSVKYLDAAREAGLGIAVVSSSANCEDVLVAAGIDQYFDVRVDGVTAVRDELKGKPAPDTFLQGAKELGASAAESVVFEDALAGVQAGRAGDFGYVVGVDRVDHAAELKEHGADVVVEDLEELLELIQDEHYSSDDWTLAEEFLDLDVLAHSESLFALSNGHVGMRGNLEEGEPHGLPGSYLNSYYEKRPLPYAEAGYGDPEAGQTLVNVTNAKIIRLLVDDEPFDVRYGELLNHRRVLDFRTGLLTRDAEWTSPAGQTVRIKSQRLVSLTHRAVAAIRYQVEPIDTDPRIVVQSELVANEPMPQPMAKDPRSATGAHDVLIPEGDSCHGLRATLLHRTERSELLSAAAMDHEFEGPEGIKTDAESNENLGRVTIATELDPGESLKVVKYIAYGWSRERSLPALRDQVEAALASARRTGWEGLVDAQREFLDDFWKRGDVRIKGDPELQQAVRFAMFHNLQAGARVERRGIPSKGLTGTGYDGHTFWDSESFVLPVLTYTRPDAARDALLWRHSTLDLARERAHQLGLEGAAFPWRTIHGEECSGYWPAGTAAFHINADIADAVVRYQHAVDDDRFERECGLELLVETARLWRSLGHHDPAGHFRIDGVTGPDEYSAIADNNVYTNLMAERNLRSAADIVERHPDEAHRLGVDTEEAASWRDAAAAMFVPYDEKLGIHEQSEDFAEHALWDFEATEPDQYPLLLHFPYYELYRKQVVKQADLVMALFARGDWFTAEEKQRNFAYYEALTVRDSSLSACVQAIVAAEVGHIDLAFDYFAEAALIDLNDSHRNTKDGLHLASLAGAWVAAVCGFGGFRDHNGELSFTPRLPRALESLSFRFTFSGRLIEVGVKHEEATYTLIEGEELELTHHGDEFTLGDEAETKAIPPAPDLERPTQPAGREPVRRKPPHA